MVSKRQKEIRDKTIKQSKNMPSNTTSTFNISGDFLGIRSKYNFNLNFFRGGYFAAFGGGRG